jgi:hypothetical protein
LAGSERSSSACVTTTGMPCCAISRRDPAAAVARSDDAAQLRRPPCVSYHKGNL